MNELPRPAQFLKYGAYLDLGRALSTSRSVGQALADNTLQDVVGASDVVYSQAHSIVVPKVKFGDVAVQVFFPAMLVDAFHAALEHAVETFNGVGMNDPPPIFTGAVAGEIVFGKMFVQVGILPSFVGHDVRARRYVRLNNRQKICRSSSGNVKGTSYCASGSPLNKGHNRAFVSIPAPHFGTLPSCR